MKANLPYFLSFPENFGKEIIEAVEKAAGKGVNLQLIGLQGSGKSLMLRSIWERRNSYIYINSGVLTERSWGELIERLDSLRSRKEQTVVLVDSFENVNEREVMMKMMSVYDQYRNFVTFVFSVEREVAMKSSYEVFYVKPATEEEAKWFIKGLEKTEGIKLDNSLEKRIIGAAGGVFGLIKRLFELVESGNKLDELVENPRNYSRLEYQLELMLGGLGEKKNNEEWLKKYYLMDSKGMFLSEVVENYLNKENKKTGKDELTAEEHRVMQFLLKNKGEVVGREDIIEKVWGDKAEEGISNHALDQLMHRLRGKIDTQEIKLETIRGRGYRLVSF